MLDFNKELTEKDVDKIILDLIKLHLESVKVNESEFLDLLKHSLSLNTMEKKRVIDAVPTLSQFQFDELSKVFIEEREKFKELSKEHPDDIRKLLGKQQKEWLQLGDLYKIEKETEEKKEDEQKKIDDIKSQFGL
ncbi:MAG: hypothetical protein PHN31_06490 [Candidatus Gracilibacteria bacterium]|nr:hypothetical protein [Candidatus Gracilibacteria bacterium]